MDIEMSRILELTDKDIKAAMKRHSQQNDRWPQHRNKYFLKNRNSGNKNDSNGEVLN